MKTFNLLAVDDSPDNLFLLEQLVETYLPECRLFTAQSAREGLELADHELLDGALIDVQLPEMDGLEMCRRLKASENSHRLAVMLITAKGSTPKLRAQGLAAGADDFISRPIDNEELMAKLRVMLRLKGAERDLSRARDQLEQRVTERTLDLAAANAKLKQEIAERKRTEDAMQRALAHASRRAAETTALLAGVRAVLEEHAFQDSARSIFESCKKLIGATSGYISLATADGATAEIAYLDTGGLPCDIPTDAPMPIRGLRAEAYQAGRAVYHNDFAACPSADLLPRGHSDIENVLFAPLIVRGTVVGLLGLANKPGGFTEDDARMASGFGEFASVALNNSRNLYSLENSEKRFRSVVETASDAILYIDQKGTIVFCNQASGRIFGYEPAEIVGQPLTTLMPAQYRSAHQHAVDRFVATRQSNLLGKTIELVGLRKDGTEFPMELSIATWETEENCFFTGIIRDITTRKQDELRLSRSERELAVRNRIADAFLTLTGDEVFAAVLNVVLDALESKHGVFGYIDEHGNFVAPSMSSEVFDQCRMESKSFVFPPETWGNSIWGRAISQKSVMCSNAPFNVPPGHIAMDREISSPIIYQDRVIGLINVANKSRDYDENDVELLRTICLHIAPVLHARLQRDRNEAKRAQAEEALRRAHHQLEDRVRERTSELLNANQRLQTEITERERAETRARQHQAQLAHVARLSTMGEMGSAIAHELNQPLCAILASAQASLRLLKSGGSCNPSVLSAIEHAAAQAKRAGEIIRHLRDFSRRRAFHRSTIRIDDVVREAAGFVAADAKPHNVQISLHLPEDLPAVLGDTIQIEQVLVNLMRNAIEAMEQTDARNRRLDIAAVSREPDMIELSIQDTGRGLPGDDPDRVFEPFFSTKSEGMGIGLGISRSIIEFHGGRLWASPAPGGGAVFRFTLPAGQAARQVE